MSFLLCKMNISLRSVVIWENSFLSSLSCSVASTLSLYQLPQMSPNMSSKDSPDLDPEILSVTGLAKSAETGLGINNFLQPPISTSSPSSDPNNCFNRMINKSVAVVKWVIRDFQLRHLVRYMHNSQSLVFSLIDCRNSISLPIICILNYFYFTHTGFI